MDGIQLSDLGGIISRLSENPSAVQALGSLLGNLNQQPPKEPPRADGGDLSGILGNLGSLLNGGASRNPNDSGADRGQKEWNDRGPHDPPKRENGLSERITGIFGTREEIKNRILLLNALRPYLSEQRRERLEMVIKFLKLTELGELGALLNRP
ncbi:MAG: hypothetical protein E7634_05290 [Ruminococcaceae bacterium]|nr:hypothetical protein [Oscillospiraceae bacterium]